MGEYLQKFFESTAGQVTSVVIILILMFLIVRGNKDKKIDVKALAVSALLIALAMILDQIKLFEMPQGGSVTLFGTLPVILCAYLLGTRSGVLAGMCVGLLNLMFGPYIIHPVQMLLDYPIAFGAMGLAGIAREKKNGLTKGYIIGVIGRYICAVLSGVIFFGAYAPEGFNALTWSLWYNITYLAVEGVATIIVINLPPVKKAIDRIKTQCEK